MYYTTTLTMPVNICMNTEVVLLESDHVTAARIFDAGCKYFHVTREAVLSSWRKREVVRARYVILYLINMHTRMVDKYIATMFNKERTILICARNYVKKELSVTAYRQQMNEDLKAIMIRLNS